MCPHSNARYIQLIIFDMVDLWFLYVYQIRIKFVFFIYKFLFFSFCLTFCWFVHHYVDIAHRNWSIIDWFYFILFFVCALLLFSLLLSSISICVMWMGASSNDDKINYFIEQIDIAYNLLTLWLVKFIDVMTVV